MAEQWQTAFRQDKGRVLIQQFNQKISGMLEH